MYNNIYFAHYSHHVVIPINSGPYPAIPYETTATHWVDLVAKYKGTKKAYNNFLAKLWDLNEGYNQSNFWDTTFHIFDW